MSSGYVFAARVYHYEHSKILVNKCPFIVTSTDTGISQSNYTKMETHKLRAHGDSFFPIIRLYYTGSIDDIRDSEGQNDSLNGVIVEMMEQNMIMVGGTTKRLRK
jgi:hypothetical protein